MIKTYMDVMTEKRLLVNLSVCLPSDTVTCSELRAAESLLMGTVWELRTALRGSCSQYTNNRAVSLQFNEVGDCCLTILLDTHLKTRLKDGSIAVPDHLQVRSLYLPVLALHGFELLELRGHRAD